jgi:hypothetical protein
MASESGTTNRVRWGVIGVVIGLLLAYLRWQSSSSPPPGRVVLPSQEFERLLGGTLVNQPRIANLTIHPSSAGYRIDSTAWEFRNLTLTQAEITVMVPPVFHPTGRVRPPADSLRFLDYMHWATERFPWVRYQYAWWEEPFWLFAGYTLVGSLIGVWVWPPALRLIADGFAFEKSEARGGYVPSQSSSDACSSDAARKEPDASELAAVLEAMQGGSGGFSAETQSAPIPRDVTAAPNKPPLEHPRPDPHERPTADDPKKQFRGDFYPTELHGKEEAG